MGWKKFWSKVEDQVKNEAENLDDTLRDNPLIAAGIPFTPQNLAVNSAGAIAVGAPYLAAGIGGAGAAGAAGAAGGSAAGAAGAAGGLIGGMSLGQLGLGLGSIGASIYGANQANKAADAQVAAADRAAQLESESAANQLALQKQIWEKQQADQAPYLQQGQWAINRLGQLMQNTSNGAAMQQPQSTRKHLLRVHGNDQQQQQYTQVANQGGGQLNNPFDTYLKSKGLANGQFDINNPAYKFQLQQGQRALDSSAAARGMGYSGAQMKAAQQFGQGLASQEYDKQYGRASQEFGDYFNRVAGLSQGGQQAANTLGSQGSNYAQNAGNTYANLSNAQTGILGQQANARASGYAARANALGNTLGSLTNLYALNKMYG